MLSSTRVGLAAACLYLPDGMFEFMSGSENARAATIRKVLATKEK